MAALNICMYTDDHMGKKLRVPKQCRLYQLRATFAQTMMLGTLCL